MTNDSTIGISFNLNPELQRVRRAVIRNNGVVIGVLGDANGIVNAPSDRRGYVRVRYDSGSDGNNNTRKSPYLLVRSDPNANYIADAGRRVRIGIDYTNELAVLGADVNDLDSAGIDTRILNPSRREKNFVYLNNVTRLKSSPVGTFNTPSTLVNVQPAIFDFYNQRTVFRGTELQADKIDLAPFIPIAGQHCIAVIWLSLLDQMPYVSVSNSQSVNDVFDATDFDESYLDRPFEAVPIQAYTLANNQSNIDVSALYEDQRQFINVPDVVGFPSVIEYRTHIRTNYRELTYSTMTLENTLNIEGTLTTL